MLDSDRRWYVERSRERLADFEAGLDNVVSRLRSMRGGYPSGGVGGGRGGNGETQPERMAGKSDPTERDLHRVDKLVWEIDERIAELDAIRLSTIERAGSADLADPGCKSCARVKLWSVVHRLGLCDWCYRFQLEHGVEPPRRLLELRAGGYKVTERVVKDSLDDVARAAKMAEKAKRHHRKRRAGR